jgi:hypothetical protein
MRLSLLSCHAVEPKWPNRPRSTNAKTECRHQSGTQDPRLVLAVQHMACNQVSKLRHFPTSLFVDVYSKNVFYLNGLHGQLFGSFSDRGRLRLGADRHWSSPIWNKSMTLFISRSCARAMRGRLSRSGRGETRGAKRVKPRASPLLSGLRRG